MSEWKTTTLGEICTDISYGYTESARTEIVGPKFLRITDIQYDFITWANVPYCLITGENHIKYKLEIGDIVIARTGASTGATAIFKDENIDAVFASYLIRYKVDKTIADPFYIGHLLRSSYWKSYVASIIGGSAQPGANAKQFAAFEFQLPDLPTQKQIAQILSSLDDKIELNLQMNQTLEAMAQAIFKEWFVNFNFPGFDGELVDGLPKGWRKVKLSELIVIKHGYAFKGEFFSDFEEDNILLTPGNFKIGGGFNSVKFKYYNGEIPQEYILQRNDLVVTMTDLSKAGDTLGYSALVPTIKGKILLHNQRIGKVLFHSELPLKYFLYWTMRQDNYRHFVLGSATGSTVKHTSPSRICDYEILLPQEFILSEFETLIKTLTDKQQENEMQIYKLTQTRDTLLPKLMSGQLAVGV